MELAACLGAAGSEAWAQLLHASGADLGLGVIWKWQDQNRVGCPIISSTAMQCSCHLTALASQHSMS